MDIANRTAGDVQILDLQGHLSIGAGDLALRDAVRRLLEQGHSRVVLDLSRLDGVDSSGLGEIIACKKRARQRGGDLRLLNPTAKVREILVVSRLADVLGIYRDEAEAVSSF